MGKKDGILPSVCDGLAMNTRFVRSELWVRIPEKSMVVAGRASDPKFAPELQQSLPVNKGENSMTRTGVNNV